MAETARSAAARIISRLLGGANLDSELQRWQLRDARDNALLAELSYGVARWYFQLAAILETLVDRPIKDDLVRANILAGLYQLRFTRVPPHAAISESVSTMRKLRRPQAAGMVNAVLRRYQRESGKLNELVNASPATRYAYPQWLVDQLAIDWPGVTEKVLEAGNERAPMWLRVNQRRTTVAEWCTRFEAEVGTQPLQSTVVDSAVCLAEPMTVERVPGFAAGEVSVQDAGAQLAAPLLDLHAGMRVLDACAAPGGKTCHVLEQADVQLTAVDNDGQRLQRVNENLERLRLEATVIEGDAANPEQWWDGKPFDRILLDVPCSATGVIRRHPDIKLLRRETDIAVLAARQSAMLTALWPLLAPGGRLLYVTCSILVAENAAVISSFLAGAPDARSRTLAAGCGQKSGSGLQLMTGEAGMDGFYYSCLEAA